MSTPTSNIKDWIRSFAQQKLDLLDGFLQRIEDGYTTISKEKDDDLKTTYLNELNEIKKSVIALREKVIKSTNRFFTRAPSYNVVAFEEELDSLMKSYRDDSAKLRNIVQDNNQRKHNIQGDLRISQPQPPTTSENDPQHGVTARLPEGTPQPAPIERGNSHQTLPMPTSRTDWNSGYSQTPAAPSGGEPSQYERGWGKFPVRSHFSETDGRHPNDDESWRCHEREVSTLGYSALSPPPFWRRPNQPVQNLEARGEGTSVNDAQRATRRGRRHFSNTCGPQLLDTGAFSASMEDSSGHESTTSMDQDNSEHEKTTSMDKGNNFSDVNDMDA